MKWNELSALSKLFWGMIIFIAAIVTPELMLFIDIGGVEMAFSFLVLYYKSVLSYFQNITRVLKSLCEAIKYSFYRSSLSDPRMYFIVTCLTLITFLTTGSLALSWSAIVPSIMIDSIHV